MKKMKWIVVLAAAVLTMASLDVALAQEPQEAPAPAPAAPAPAPEGEAAAPAAPTALDMDKISYAIGLMEGRQLATSLQGGGIDINVDRLLAGYQAGLTGTEAELGYEEVEQTFSSLRGSLQQMQQQAPQKNLARGEAFLKENATKEGVQSLPSGVQYRVLQEGTGESPTLEKTVKVNYRGRLLSGAVFDSSYSRGEPATFPLSGVIPGWQEALQKMKVGAKWEIFIPAKLAYGEQGQRGIPPNSVLIFDVELLEVMDAPAQPQGAEVPLPQPGQPGQPAQPQQ